MSNKTTTVPNVDAVLFDMDGTLIDSSKTCAIIWGRWAERYGLDTEEVIHVSHGRRPEDTATIILGPDADIAAAVAVFEEEEAKEKHVVTIPGTAELLAKLPQDKWAIVTSSTKKMALERLDYCKLPHPKALVTAEVVSKGKPDPEGYLQAAKTLGADIKNCIVFEDAPGGVEAGHNSGAKVVVLGTTYTPEHWPNDEVILDLTSVDVQVDPTTGKLTVSYTPV